MYEVDTRPPYAIPCGSHKGDDGDVPLYLHPWLREETTCHDTMLELLNASPSPRVCLHWPMGKSAPNADGELCGSAQWWSAEAWRQDAMAQAIRDAGVVPEIYLSCRQWRPDTMEPTTDHHDLDTRDPTSLSWFLHTILPWAEIGVTRFWLDAASLPDRWAGAYRVAKWIEPLGVTLGMEAIPLKPNGCVRWRVWQAMPAMCTNQFITPQRFPDGLPAVPDGCEGVIWLTGHDRTTTAEDVARWRENGWVIGSLDRRAGDPLIWP